MERVEVIERCAAWRRQMADLHPDDGAKHLAAAGMLDGIASQIRKAHELPDEVFELVYMHGHFDAAYEEAIEAIKARHPTPDSGAAMSVFEIINDELRHVGIENEPENAAALLRDISHRLRRVARGKELDFDPPTSIERVLADTELADLMTFRLIEDKLKNAVLMPDRFCETLDDIPPDLRKLMGDALSMLPGSPQLAAALFGEEDGEKIMTALNDPAVREKLSAAVRSLLPEEPSSERPLKAFNMR